MKLEINHLDCTALLKERGSLLLTIGFDGTIVIQDGPASSDNKLK